MTVVCEDRWVFEARRWSQALTLRVDDGVRAANSRRVEHRIRWSAGQHILPQGVAVGGVDTAARGEHGMVRILAGAGGRACDLVLQPILCGGRGRQGRRRKGLACGYGMWGYELCGW